MRERRDRTAGRYKIENGTERKRMNTLVRIEPEIEKQLKVRVLFIRGICFPNKHTRALWGTTLSVEHDKKNKTPRMP